MREGILAQAEAVAAHFETAFPGVPLEQVALVLSGSGATEFADDHSGVDLLLISADPSWEAAVTALWGVAPVEPGQTLRAYAGNQRFKCAAWPHSAFSRLVRDHDDVAMFSLTHGRILHDPGGLLPPLLAVMNGVSAAAWHDKARERHRLFRQRKASLAWALRRGQPFVCLDNLQQLLGHCLCMCYYLDCLPPANRKWLLRGAMRTRTGQEIRPLVFELLSSLGDIALLGGSFNLRHNRLYGLLSRMQGMLEAAMSDAEVGNR